MFTAISLNVRGDFLKPNEVTKALNIEPSYSCSKGEVEILKTGKERIAKFGAWTKNMKSVKEKFSLDKSINLIFDLFMDSIIQVKNIPNSEYTWLDILVLEDEKAKSNSLIKNVEFTLSLESIEKLKKFKIPVEFTVDLCEE